MHRSLIFIYLLAGTLASADVFQRIDVNKQADVNGQTVNLPVLNFDSLPQTSRTLPIAPQSDRRTEPGKTIETSTVNLETLAFPTLDMQTVPKSNYKAKRAVVSGAPVTAPRIDPSATVPAERAKVNERVIRPLTPAGEQELKDQFHKTP